MSLEYQIDSYEQFDTRGHLFPPLASGNQQRESMHTDNRKKPKKSQWKQCDLRVITRTTFTADYSLQRETVVEMNWLTFGDVLYADSASGYPLRFTTSTDERLDRKIPPGSRLIIEQCRFSDRKGNKERELEVKKFRIVGPDWSWVIGSTQIERDIEFLRGGDDLEDLFNEHPVTSLLSTTL
jgi:hypothetical protein